MRPSASLASRPARLRRRLITSPPLLAVLCPPTAPSAPDLVPSSRRASCPAGPIARPPCGTCGRRAWWASRCSAAARHRSPAPCLTSIAPARRRPPGSLDARRGQPLALGWPISQRRAALAAVEPCLLQRRAAVDAAAGADRAAASSAAHRRDDTIPLRRARLDGGPPGCVERRSTLPKPDTPRRRLALDGVPAQPGRAASPTPARQDPAQSAPRSVNHDSTLLEPSRCVESRSTPLPLADRPRWPS